MSSQTPCWDEIKCLGLSQIIKQFRLILIWVWSDDMQQKMGYRVCWLAIGDSRVDTSRLAFGGDTSFVMWGLENPWLWNLLFFEVRHYLGEVDDATIMETIPLALVWLSAELYFLCLVSARRSSYPKKKTFLLSWLSSLDLLLELLANHSKCCRR